MQTESTECVSLHRSLEAVLRGNSGRWFRFILGILKNEADAEDVIQEAVRRVLSRNRSFPTEEQVRLYLGRAIGNTAFEMYNSRKRDRLRNTPIRESVLFKAGCKGPETLMEEKEEARRKNTMLELLFEGLKKLPEKQEKALRITILESGGRSIRDTGVMFRIPYSTLRHRNKQGLRKMRRFLERSMAGQERPKV
jgi:RNA polymerase sigma-70 factor (ECF subfamily)